RDPPADLVDAHPLVCQRLELALGHGDTRRNTLLLRELLVEPDQHPVAGVFGHGADRTTARVDRTLTVLTVTVTDGINSMNTTSSTAGAPPRASTHASEHLSDEERYRRFGEELDSLKERVLARVGAEDVAYVRRLNRFSRTMEI